MGVSIQETFSLPSKGKLYSSEVDPEITLRSMTTLEEKKRLGNTNNQFKLLATIIDDCILNKNKGFTCYDLTAGDFQYLLFKLRTVTYGNMYKMTLRCPICGSTFEHVQDLDLLEELKYEEGMEEALNITLPKSGDIIKLNLLTPRMSDTIENRSKEILRKNPNYEGDPTYILTIMALIDTVNGEKLPESKKQKYVEDMLMADANYLRHSADKVKIGVDTHCTATCKHCKNPFPFLLPFTQEFLGPSID